MGGQVSRPSPPNPSSTATKSSSDSPLTNDLQQPQKMKTRGSQKEKQAGYSINSESLLDLIGEEQRKGAGTALWLALTNQGFGDTIVHQMEKCAAECLEKGEDVEVAVKKCINARAMMKWCMDAKYDYVEPLLRAERDALDEVLRQAKKNKWKKKLSL